MKRIKCHKYLPHGICAYHEYIYELSKVCDVDYLYNAIKFIFIIHLFNKN